VPDGFHACPIGGRAVAVCCDECAQKLGEANSNEQKQPLNRSD
jgi:hypothetical protein